MKVAKSEFGLIEWIRRQRRERAEGVITDIGDDMAVLETGGRTVLITTDMLMDGVHFDLQQVTPEQAGYKAMVCSLSDCAAMAAVPWVAVVAAALPKEWSMAAAQRLYGGLEKAAVEYQCPIVGGDTTSWDKPLAVDVTMLARPGKGKPVLRSGARVGDAILVTGELGGSLGGRHVTFSPRVTEAQLLAELVELHAMIDISDGLSRDMDHICQESKVAAELEAEGIPISKAGRESTKPLEAALHDGEDFELLFCVDGKEAEKLRQEWPKRSDVRLSRIGRIVAAQEDQRLFLRASDGTMEPLMVKGWEHFRE